MTVSDLIASLKEATIDIVSFSACDDLKELSAEELNELAEVVEAIVGEADAFQALIEDEFMDRSDF